MEALPCLGFIFNMTLLSNGSARTSDLQLLTLDRLTFALHCSGSIRFLPNVLVNLVGVIAWIICSDVYWNSVRTHCSL